jgi:ribosomal protein S27AE
MYKENGRLSPADEKELAHKHGKMFECGKCGYIEMISNPEFGGSVDCPKCKGVMVERI